MLVKAAPELRVPHELKPREYITEDAPAEVPESAYYLRRLAEGDLVRVEAAKPQQVAKTEGKKE